MEHNRERNVSLNSKKDCEIKRKRRWNKKERKKRKRERKIATKRKPGSQIGVVFK